MMCHARGARVRGTFARSVAIGGLVVGCGMFGSVRAQTFQPTSVIDITVCSTFLGITSGCNSITTDRLSQSFVQSKLGFAMFGNTWGIASHCTTLDPNAPMCKNAVQANTDPLWNRIVWMYANTFMAAYGSYGGAKDGAGNVLTGRFSNPRGISMTQRWEEWHAVFVADAGNNRVVGLALGMNCRCVKWMGTVDGSESGLRLNTPWDVAWDPAFTWNLLDDRLFIVDKGNSRVVVYHVAIDTTDAANPHMSTSYLSSFGTQGAGTNQFNNPEGIAVRMWQPGWTNVYVSDTKNHRISEWAYDGASNLPGTASPLHVTSVSANSQLAGMSLDQYGDVYAADRGTNTIRSFASGSLIPLKVYGGNSTWLTGNFNLPSRVDIIYAHRESISHDVRADVGLPYIATSEAWTTTTGGELHRLGVDADSLAVTVPNTPGARTATLSFLFTSTGTYTVSINNISGVVVRTLVANHVGYGAWQTLSWDGKDNSGVIVPYGSYTALISFVSGYSYDTNPRTATKSFSFTPIMSVSISGPTSVIKGTSHTWNSAITGGASPFTYAWKIGTTAVGTSASYTGTRSTCGPFTLNLTVTDANQHVASATFDVDVTGGSPPCAV
jgi:hypothetical protein